MGVNPNVVTAAFAEYWSRRFQIDRKKTAVFREISNFAEAPNLKNGQKVHRPFSTKPKVRNLGADGSYATKGKTVVDEYLLIDQEKEVSEYYKTLDGLQSNYDLRNDTISKFSQAMTDCTDAYALKTMKAQAGDTVDDGDLGGTAGNGITMAATNIAKIFSKAGMKMDRKSVDQNNRWVVMTPDFYATLWERLEGKDGALGDEVAQNGKLARGYAGFRLYKCNNSPWSTRLAMATNPTNGDTIVINGVTLTFKDSLAAAGDVHICSDVEKTINNLIVALETPDVDIAEATDTGYKAVSSTQDSGNDYVSNEDKLWGITCTDGATYVDIVVQGGTFISVSDTLTAPADGFTAAKQVQSVIFGQGKPLDLVIQKEPNVYTNPVSGKIGVDLVNWSTWGGKVFRENKDCIIDAQIRTDAF